MECSSHYKAGGLQSENRNGMTTLVEWQKIRQYTLHESPNRRRSDGRPRKIWYDNLKNAGG